VVSGQWPANRTCGVAERLALDGILLSVIRPLSFLLFAVALSFPAAYGQSIAELAKSLEGHNFVLRNYYTDDELTFDNTGKLDNRGTPGFGPTDGLVHIEKVEAAPAATTLTGQRPIYFWDFALSDFKLVNVGQAVKIKIALGNAEVANMAEVLKQVFLSQSELQQYKCGDTDRKIKGFAPNGSPRKQPSTTTSAEQDKVLCFPGGERIPHSSKKTEPPRVIHDPDPELPKVGRNEPSEGTVVLALIVDTSGNPSTLVVTRPLGYGYDEEALAAVRHWKFRPAISDGKPIPVFVNLEVNFRR
jgi:TonB family protein